MPAVDQHHQLNRLRPSEFDQGVERRANRSTGIQNIVNQQDALIVDGERDVGSPDDGLREETPAT